MPKSKPDASIEGELVRTVRAVTRLENQARRLRKQLKRNQADLRQERRNLKALKLRLGDERRPDVAPMRLFAGSVGITRD